MKKSFVKATKGTFLYPWAEFAMGRDCYGPSLLWAEMSRNPSTLSSKTAELTTIGTGLIGKEEEIK